MFRCAAGLLAVMLATMGCAGTSFLGYTTHGMYPEHIRTVAVPIFKNTGFRRDIEFKLTQEVVRELERVGFKVVPAERADVELIGTINDVAKMSMGLDGFSNPRGGMLYLSASIRCVERRTGKTLQEGEIGVDPRPYNLRSSDSFLIDVGQSFATAEDRAIKELARNIVALLQTPW
jgi:hypothetical protein